MPRHANYLPHGVIPAVLLPFNEALSIDEGGFSFASGGYRRDRRHFSHNHQCAFD